MKLHKVERGIFDVLPCGVGLIKILTGHSEQTINKGILNIRKKYPRDYYGQLCPKAKMLKHTEFTFLSEIKKYLTSNKVKLGNFRKFSGKIVKFCEQFPKGTYFIDYPKHVAVVQDGKIYDNCHEGVSPKWYGFPNDNIIGFAEIKN